MPVPKRKHSKRRVRVKRNSHYFRTVPNTVRCSNCNAEKLPHVVCPECGHYDSSQNPEKSKSTKDTKTKESTTSKKSSTESKNESKTESKPKVEKKSKAEPKSEKKVKSEKDKEQD